MYLKKIILLSWCSWFCVHSNQYYAWDLGNLKNSPAERNMVIKMAVLWSTCWIINKFIQHACVSGLKRPVPEDTIWKKIGYGIQGVGAEGGFSMIAKTTVMSYAAWNLKNYYYHK